MREELFMAGIGGQGVNLAGQLVARAGMEIGLNVSWFPIYSPEVRGGSSTCTIVLTDGRVASPTSDHPTSMILMDPTSVQDFVDRLADGGLVVINSSLVSEVPDCGNCRVLMVPANDIAAEIGNERTLNMSLLGAWAAGTGVMTAEDVARSLREMLPERHHRHMPDNEKALERGAEIARSAGI
ncbi:MAG: 2-oxoacid:acceptor oxidoreductase family protein [Armatimonadota bacterium]